MLHVPHLLLSTNVITRCGLGFWPMQGAPYWIQPGLNSNRVGHGSSTRRPIGPEDSGAEPGANLTRIPNRVVAQRETVAPIR